MLNIKADSSAGINPALLRLKTFPNNLVGSVLGVAGLGLVLRELAVPGISSSIVLVCLNTAAAIMLTVILTLYACKALLFRGDVLDDFRHPLLFLFYGQTPIAIFLFCETAYPYSTALAQILFWFGALLTAIHSSIALYRWIAHPRALKTIAPPILIPVLSIVYLGLLAPRFGLVGLSQCAFIGGGCASAILLLILTIKLIPLAISAASTAVPYGLLMAPPALLFLSRVNLAGHATDALSTLLLYIGLGYSLLLLPVFVTLWRKSYSTAFWSFGMPLAAMVLALHEYATMTGSFTMAMLTDAAAALLAATIVRCLLGMARSG